MAARLRRLILLLLVLGGLTTAVAQGWYWWEHGRFRQSTDNAYLRADITPIAARVAGYVAEIAVTDNQRVEKGQVLVRLDDADFLARVANVEAEIAARRASLAQVGSRITLQTSMIAQVEADIAAVEAEIKRSTHELDRARRLIASSATTGQRLEQAEAAAETARAQLRRGRAAHDAARQQQVVLQAEKNQIEAQLGQSQASLKIVQKELADTVMLAPVAGVVGNRTGQPGQYVRVGQTLMNVVAIDDVWVVANFKETQVARMTRGQTVIIEIDAFPGDRLTGRVDSLSPASGQEFALLPAENATGNFTKIVQRVPVKIVLERASLAPVQSRLRPGLSVVATVDARAGATARPLGLIEALGDALR
jgi:membrane fusion protein (multidrug efflux system)